MGERREHVRTVRRRGDVVDRGGVQASVRGLRDLTVQPIGYWSTNKTKDEVLISRQGISNGHP